MNQFSQPTLTLVLGATGKTGRRIAQRLRERGLAVREGSRAGRPAFDWEDRSTWPIALHGVDAVYVSFQPDLAVPGALDTVTAFFEQAQALGVRRAVLLSGRGEAEAEQAEDALRATGLSWTILRASWFNQNFSESLLLEGVLAGTVAMPVGSVAEPFVDTEDIADAAVAALTEPGHQHQLYELTGPRALRFDEAVQCIAQATGRELRFAAITPEEFSAGARAAQMPEDVIALVLYLCRTVLDGRNTPVADGVQRALKRAPRSFERYAADTAASGVWQPA